MTQPADGLDQYPLLKALRGRRSRRFGWGMKIDEGPFAYHSTHPPLPLSEAEEAALAFAACGITGFALADLSYGAGQGGSMLAGLLGRTVASPDALNTVSVFVTNDTATYLLPRPQELPTPEIAELIQLAEQGDLTELYGRCRVRIRDGRAAPPVGPGYNYNINRWSLYAPGGTYFLPVNDLTAIYLNALLEAFDESMGLFIIDERAGFRPAGLRRFGKTRGGHLEDDPRAGRTATIQLVEASLMEAAAVEQGMVLQNLGLMSQALGLGGFSNFARHEYAWFQALGFQMLEMAGSRYLGAPPLLSWILGIVRRDQPVPYPVGLEASDGTPLLRAFCPPHYPSMAAAVRGFVETKFGPKGVFRGQAIRNSGWRDPQRVSDGVPGTSPYAVEATIAYCEYVYARYGRFPAYSAPFRTVLGYQATHVDQEFYDRFFRPEALTETQRQHLARWHPEVAA